MARMGNSERLFRQIIQRRLDGAVLPPVDVMGTHSGDNPDDDIVVSPRAEAVAALSMMVLKTTFTRMRSVDGDPGPVVDTLFDELRALFREETD